MLDQSFSTNMPHIPDLVSKVLEMLKRAISIVLLIVLFSILQYIFDMHFVCSCKPGLHPNGVLYLLLPALILTFVVIIFEPFYQKRTFSSWHSSGFSGCRGSCGRCLLNLIFRFFSLSAVWMTMVLLDGDWYFCLMTNFNATQTGIPCKADLTYDEQRIKDFYMTQSLDYGLWLGCFFLCLWSIVETRAYLKITKCRARKPFGCCPPYYKVVYEHLLAEEVSNHLDKKLEEIAKNRAETICARRIQDIKDYLQSDGNDELSEVWGEISDPSFYLKKPEEIGTPV